MSTKEKVCRNCKRFVKGTVCPVCNQANFSRSWKGVIFIKDPAGSEVAKHLDITHKGKYSVWVK